MDRRYQRAVLYKNVLYIYITGDVYIAITLGQTPIYLEGAEVRAKLSDSAWKELTWSGSLERLITANPCETEEEYFNLLWLLVTNLRQPEAFKILAKLAEKIRETSKI